MQGFSALPLVLALAGCVTVYPPDDPPADDGAGYAALGQTVSVGGPRLTPLRVLEDSRCPALVRCVWAGQVRLSVRIATGAGTATREIVSNKPLAVAGGTLTLAEVQPQRGAPQAAITPSQYRFGFRFAR